MLSPEPVPTLTVRQPSKASGIVPTVLPGAALDSESAFYGRYRWCLNAFPTFGEVKLHLVEELSALPPEHWQREEVACNIFLLSCALLDTADDFLTGENPDFGYAVAVFPWLRLPAKLLEFLFLAGRRIRDFRLRHLHRWRARCGAAVDTFLRASYDGEPGLSRAKATLTVLVTTADLPKELLRRRLRMPAAFRTQDLTHHDVRELADRFEAAFPDRKRPVLVVGLRTAGSYFAPLVRALLARHGFEDVSEVTLRPKNGIARWERAALARCAARGGRVAIVDEPADTGATLAQVVALLRRIGVPPIRVVALLPVHPTRRNWRDEQESLPLADIRVLALEPEDSHKHRLLERGVAAERIEAYFRVRGYSNVAVPPSPTADKFNRQLQRRSEEKFHSRLKRVYEVRLRRPGGPEETRYVLAKSVGWGWLGYHAFLAAQALRGFVPAVLGLRDGILYEEWLPQNDPLSLRRDRSRWIERASAYVAARTRALRLTGDPTPELDAHNQKGWTILTGVLSRAYGWKPSAVLKRPRIRRLLSARPCPYPTFIDGKMRPEEWVRAGSFLKTDFEHHGFGKTELNITDPAYDLAEIILHFRLTPTEEERLLACYREPSGDHDVTERLFLYKILAGSAALTAALDNLKEPRLRHLHQESNRRYFEAWDYLAAHTARFCGRRCQPPATPAWRSPLVAMDVDGVLDKQIFGFPSTTAAGIRALELLHKHGVPIALNTARNLFDVQEYSFAYGCVGGVAEYGSVVWDRVSGKKRVLVTPESRRELDQLAAALRGIPGVFLNDQYQHSLRAYTYDRRRTAPLPGPLVTGLLTDLGLSRLRVHQTYLDTAILAREVDKGKGLRQLLALAGCENVETIAIGDSEPDFDMFRVAKRSFAPGHVSSRKVAALLGCQIVPRSYQPGFLQAVESALHPGGDRCPRCKPSPKGDDLFGKLLEVADQRPLDSLVRAFVDPMSVRALLR